MAGSFWPYLIPFSVTIADAVPPASSLRFQFCGAGPVVIPMIIICIACAYGICRGKVRAKALCGRCRI